VLLTGAGPLAALDLARPELLRLPPAALARREVAITIDDGPDPEVTPAVLDLLDAHGARATFFCIAEQARAQPALCREITRRGHSVQNHSERHSHLFSMLGPRGLADEIGRAQQTLADITGQRPSFFRAPAGLRSPLLRRCCTASSCSSSAGPGAATTRFSASPAAFSSA
jgi:peptidoglycan/xylan/chitin deacetylase (PgdA/CDA1 family)